MLNQATTSNILQSITRGAHKDAAAKPAGKQDANAGNTFGSVLSRQMEGKKIASAEKTEATTSDTIPTLANSSAKTSDTLIEQDNITAAEQTVTPLAAMLFANQEIRTPVAADVENRAVTKNDIRALTADKETVKTETDVDATLPLTNDSKTQQNRATRDLAQDKFAATATQAKTDATLSAQPATKSSAGSDSLNIAEAATVHTGTTATPQLQSASALLTSSLQPAAATNVSNNPVTVAAPLGSNAWPDEFSQKVSWISTQQSQTAELHLNPPDLGPMSVVLTIADKQATALFTSPHSAVRDAIENALPKLREILSDNGIMLGNATVSDQAPRDGHSASFTQQQSRSESARAIASEKSEALPLITSRRHNGMVDTFA